MMANVLKLTVLVCFVLPLAVCSAPASIYGKALQKAKNTAAQAENTRKETADKPADKKVAAKAFSLSGKQANDIAAAIKKAKYRKYPLSGARGVSELLAKKVIKPEQLGLAPDKTVITEKECPIAWFGTEANRVKKEPFPLFIVKPGRGEVAACMTNGSVSVLKQAPRSLTGAVTVLRSSAKNKKSPQWESFLKRARKIDKASK